MSPQLDPCRIAWRPAITLLFSANGFGFGAWVAHMPAFKAALELSDGTLGLALLGAALASLVAMPLAGAAIARRGSRGVALASGIAASLSLALPFLAQTYAVFVAAAIVIGAAYSTFDVAMNAQAVACETRVRKPLMSSFHAAFSFGGLFGSLASMVTISRGFGRTVDGLVAAAICVALVAIAIPSLLDDPLPPRAPAAAVARARRLLLPLGAIALLGLLSEGAMADWSGVYLRDVLRQPAATSAAGFGAFSIAMAFGRLAGDRIVVRFGQRGTLAGGATLAAGALGAALLAPDPVITFAAFAIVGLGLANVVPIVFGTAGHVPGLGAGVGIAAVSTLGYAGFVVGPPAIGLTADAFGLRWGLGLVVASIAAIAGVAPLALGRGSARAYSESGSRAS